MSKFRAGCCAMVKRREFGQLGDFSSACQLTFRGWIESQKRDAASGRCQSAGIVPGTYLHFLMAPAVKK